ncbi:unnamed protein product [Porites evermanni]|uniref:Uncharacterized protein n=1 Tax=Porites evermanni TaxID=104178 RepID=A0ABN8LDZ5_9CNID|nr:unnamed protein product [Porites evermanni]
MAPKQFLIFDDYLGKIDDLMKTRDKTTSLQRASVLVGIERKMEWEIASNVQVPLILNTDNKDGIIESPANLKVMGQHSRVQRPYQPST